MSIESDRAEVTAIHHGGYGYPDDRTIADRGPFIAGRVELGEDRQAGAVLL